MVNAIELRNANKVYGKNESLIYALKNINLEVKQGEMLAITGASGSGKSTLLNIIGLLDVKTEGIYNLFGENTSNLSDKKKANLRNSTLGFVVQDFALIEKYTVKQNVELPFAYSTKKLRSSEKKAAISSVLERLGIINKMNSLVSDLSGGQRQRVAIARALLNDPKIILADEPTGAVDTKTAGEIIKILKELNREGKTIIIVTHNVQIAEQCDKTLVMSDGQILEPC